MDTWNYRVKIRKMSFVFLTEMLWCCEFNGDSLFPTGSGAKNCFRAHGWKKPKPCFSSFSTLLFPSHLPIVNWEELAMGVCVCARVCLGWSQRNNPQNLPPGAAASKTVKWECVYSAKELDMNVLITGVFFVWFGGVSWSTSSSFSFTAGFWNHMFTSERVLLS